MAAAQLVVSAQPWSFSPFKLARRSATWQKSHPGPAFAAHRFGHSSRRLPLGQRAKEGRQGRRDGATESSKWRAAAEELPEVASGPAVVKVKAGDTLLSLAKEHDTTVGDLWRLNQDILAHPDAISANGTIRVPQLAANRDAQGASASRSALRAAAKGGYVAGGRPRHEQAVLTSSTGGGTLLPERFRAAAGSVAAEPRGIAVIVASLALVIAACAAFFRGDGERSNADGLVKSGLDGLKDRSGGNARRTATDGSTRSVPAVVAAAAQLAVGRTATAGSTFRAAAPPASAEVAAPGGAVEERGWLAAGEAWGRRASAGTGGALPTKPQPLRLEGEESTNREEDSVKERVAAPTFSAVEGAPSLEFVPVAPAGTPSSQWGPWGGQGDLQRLPPPWERDAPKPYVSSLGASSPKATPEEAEASGSQDPLGAAVPALAVTAGATMFASKWHDLLEVVGFAGLLSFVTYNLLWAERRRELWEEVSRLRDHRQLFQFLQRRNILRPDEREPWNPNP